MSVLIINYHKISLEKNVHHGLDNLYTVTKDDFIEQIEKISALKIPIIPLSQLVENLNSNKLHVALTFDDGNTSDYEIAFPFLKNLNLPASFFVLVHEQVDWKQLKEMADAGFEIGSHGLFHKDLTSIKEESLREELIMSKKRIEKELNTIVHDFSFPFGRFNDRVVAECYKSSYVNMFSTHFGLNKTESSTYKRWSIKSSTTLEQIEKVLTSLNYRNKLERTAKLKYSISKVIGKKTTDYLNQLVGKNFK